MSLKFCPKCQSILIPEENKKGKIETKCAHCGYLDMLKEKKLVEYEKIKHRKEKKGKIENVHNEFADYKHKCQKCGYGKAQIIDMGVSYSDEDNLILLKCGRCGWSERVGKKAS